MAHDAYLERRKHWFDIIHQIIPKLFLIANRSRKRLRKDMVLVAVHVGYWSEDLVDIDIIAKAVDPGQDCLEVR